MGFFSKSDGFAIEPTRSGAQTMRGKDGKPVRISELTKEQRKSMGMGLKPQKRPKNTDKFWR